MPEQTWFLLSLTKQYNFPSKKVADFKSRFISCASLHNSCGLEIQEAIRSKIVTWRAEEDSFLSVLSSFLMLGRLHPSIIIVTDSSVSLWSSWISSFLLYTDPLLSNSSRSTPWNFFSLPLPLPFLGLQLSDNYLLQLHAFQKETQNLQRSNSKCIQHVTVLNSHMHISESFDHQQCS